MSKDSKALRYLRRTLAGLGAFFLGGGALLLLASPFLGSGAGLGVALIAYTLSAIALAFAVSATAGATLRHLWDFFLALKPAAGPEAAAARAPAEAAAGAEAAA